MQDLEKNMDDLFRKAVENYRVNPGESNWNKIAPQLSEPALPATNKKKINGKKYKGLVLLLMFLMLGGGILIKYTPLGNLKSTLAYKPSQKIKPDTSHKQSYLNNKKSSDIKPFIVKKNPSLLRQFPENDFLLGKKNKRHTFTTTDINNSQNHVNIFSNKEEQISPFPIQKDDVKNLASINNQKILNEAEQNKLFTVRENHTDSSATSSGQRTKISRVTKQHGIYLGFLGGPSLNKIKNQRLRKPGFDIGFTTGYQFSDKISVETGIFLSKKYYFTEGKYFSMEKISASMPPQMKVMSVDGSSTVFEIPLKFKYNVCSKNNHAFFSSAGLSSYVLTKEKNDYHTLMNGTNETVTSSYKNSSSYIAGAVNISLGYEHTIGNGNNKLRIEPYVQIPLRGIGMGALPVTTTGLHLGFSLSPH